MKIAFCGTSCVGKSTLINDFLKTWPNYALADKSYREKAKNNPKLKLNQAGDEESQVIIRDALIDQTQAYSRSQNILFDRCILDNIVYTMWLNYKGQISDLFVERQIPIVKETLKTYDIIFFIPMLAKYPIEIVPSEDGQRDTDPQFREEIDNLFKATLKDYYKQKRTFFPYEDCPAVIEIFGSPQERIQMIKLYLNENGLPYGEEQSLIKEI